MDGSGRVGTFLEGLDSEVADCVLDRSLWAGYEWDWTRRWHGRVGAVVRPRTVDQVVALVRTARDHQVALVPRGGGTGLVGGCVPTGDGDQVVVDMALFRSIEIDPVGSVALVGAGTTLGELNAAARRWDLRFAVDIASRDSATLGGMVCTNAGGLHMLRYGDTASSVLGLQMVTGAGEVLEHTLGLAKDNTGLRWHQLVAGSEGCLGLVCAVQVALVPVIAASAHCWFPVDDAGQAVEIAVRARQVPSVSAVEYVHGDGTGLVARLVGRRPPTPGAAVVVEASSAAAGDDLVGELAVLAAHLGMHDRALVADGSRGAELWQWRERHTEAVAAVGVAAKCDVAVPLTRWAELHDQVPGVLADIDERLWAIRFGHVADGNLHVNVLARDGTEVGAQVDDAIWELAVSLGGTVSAEHGIGVAKAPWLGLVRSHEELGVFERTRRAFDPDGIMVPHLWRTG